MAHDVSVNIGSDNRLSLRLQSIIWPMNRTLEINKSESVVCTIAVISSWLPCDKFVWRVLGAVLIRDPEFQSRLHKVDVVESRSQSIHAWRSTLPDACWYTDANKCNLSLTKQPSNALCHTYPNITCWICVTFIKLDLPETSNVELWIISLLRGALTLRQFSFHLQDLYFRTLIERNNVPFCAIQMR